MNPQTDQAIGILETLVGFDTTSRDSNLPLIEWVAQYFAALDIPCERLMDPTGEKASLLARIGGGAGGAGGVVLSGHTDVVPVDGQDWRSDPFRLTRDGDRLYGRGSADMKGFVACALAAAPAMAKARLNRPVHFAFSYDEEVGCLGAGDIVARMASAGLSPEICLIGEPTMMKVVNAHKGCYTFRTRLTGLEAHSSRTDLGVNTVMFGAELVRFIAGLAEERKQRRDPLFTPPHTTVHVGAMHGGTVINIVPQQCEILWEFRNIPGDDADDIPARVQAFIDDELLPRMRATHPEAAIVTETDAAVPGLSPETDGAAEALIKRLARQNAVEVVAYGTEGGIFQNAGMSTVICGPGDITVAHRPDEYVETGQLSLCMDLMDRLTAELGG